MTTYRNIDERYGNPEIVTEQDYRDLNPGGEFRSDDDGIYERVGGELKLIAEAVATLETVLSDVSEIDGAEATYGGGDYTITVWDDMEGGYDVVFTRSNSMIAHETISGLTADEAIAKMREFQSDPAKWYAVEFES